MIKIEIGRQDKCKNFQNDHVKAIENEKKDVLFMVWLRLSKVEKSMIFPMFPLFFQK
jgi:hypothetical protein